MGCKSIQEEFIAVSPQGGPARLDRSPDFVWGPLETWTIGHLLPRSEGRTTHDPNLFGEIADPNLITPND